MTKTDPTEYHIGLLRELCKLPNENGWVEFKCNNSNPEEIGEYISALSNSAALCGKANAYLVWGVANDTHDVVGTTYQPSRARKGGEELENWLVQLLSPQIHFQFIEFTYDGMQISMIEIPRASHRPVQFQGQEFIRVGSYKKKLKDHPEKERDLWAVFEAIPFELQVASERLAGTDVLSSLDYPTYFELLDLPLPENREQILSRLADDDMISPRHDGLWDVLNLGAILFAKNLDQFRHLKRKCVRLIAYEGDSRIETKREHEGHMGYAAGHEGLIGFLKAMLPENEVIGEALRKTVPMYPELAIRELVANAIIHQDFTMTGAGPMIEVFATRLEITNPGQPLMDTQRFLDTPPQSRNESLASFLRRVGICEERGSGVDKVVFQTEFFQLPAPLFETAGGQTRAVLFAHKPFAKMDKADRIRACYLHACLQRVNRDYMTNASLRKRFGIAAKNSSQASRVIADTVSAKLVRRHDPTSGKKYVKYVPFWD